MVVMRKNEKVCSCILEELSSQQPSRHSATFYNTLQQLTRPAQVSMKHDLKDQEVVPAT